MLIVYYPIHYLTTILKDKKGIVYNKTHLCDVPSRNIKLYCVTVKLAMFKYFKNCVPK